MKLLILYVLLSMMLSCTLLGNDAQFGVKEVMISDSVKIYLIREVKGVLGNSDHTYISPRRDLCEISTNGSEFAYEFDVKGEVPFLYHISNQKLEVFSRTELISPSKETFPIEMVSHKVTMQEFNELRSKANQLGLIMAELEIDKKLKCGFFDSTK